MAREDGGPVEIEVLRSDDLSRAVPAEAVLAGNGATIRVPLQFAPRETRKIFSVPIADDDVFTGRRMVPLKFENPKGGVLTAPLTGTPELIVLDDDPPPSLSIAPPFTIAEGSERRDVRIPLSLSAPMAIDVLLGATFTWVLPWPDPYGSTKAVS